MSLWQNLFHNRLRVVAGAAALAIAVAGVTSCSSVGAGKPTSGPAAPLPSSCEARPPACLELALAEKEAGRVERAGAVLEDVRRAWPGTIWAARASFLLGVAALEGAGDAPVETAPWLYFRGVDRAGALAHIGDYVLFFQARSLAGEGAHGEAAEAYRAIGERFPGSVLKTEAAFSRAVSLVEAGELAQGRELMLEYARNHPGDEHTPEALLAAARASVALGEPEKAENPVRRLLVFFPAHEAAETVSGLLAGEWKGVVAEPVLTSAERYTRARRFFESARFAPAAELFGELARDRDGEFFRRASLKEADSLVRIKRYGEAERALRALLPEMEDGGPGRLDAVYLLALVAARQGHTADLVAMERKLAAEYPASGERARVLLFTARHFERGGDPATAARYYRKVTEEFSGSGKFGWAVDEALWGTGWMAFSSGDVEGAYRIFSSYGDAGSGGMAQRFLYWTGRTAEDTGRVGVALGSYATICDEYDDRGYYCLMGAERSASLGLAAGGGDGPAVARAALSSGAARAPAEAADGFSRDPHYLAANELLTLGLGPLAAGETEYLASKYSGDEGVVGRLAAMFYEAGDYYRALRVYRRHLYSPGARGPLANPGGLTREELSFPSPLVERIRRIDGDGRVDPFLVAAVIREESTFNPGAVSRTGAVGLMQIMPSTGRYIAERLGRKDFKRDDLLDPETNIRFGAWYLGHLARMFDGRVVPTVAGYNAGPGAASRWLESLPADTDVFIESIPYPETRAYAKRVLSSYSGFRRNAGNGAGDIFVMP